MGLKSWLGKVFGGDSPEPGEDDEAPAVGDVEDDSESGAGGENKEPKEDPLVALRTLPVARAVTRAIEILDASPSPSVSVVVVGWLRNNVSNAELSIEARLRAADFFLERSENELAADLLRPAAADGTVASLPALARLADLAQQRGDVAEVARRYEDILSVDVTYPGVRERLRRMRSPAKAGGAGATLLSPEATKVAQGRLELVREIGRGGAGAVFLARDSRVGRDVALKIYHPAKRGERSSRLRAEASVAASLSSRHVVRVYDLLEELGAVTMEFCTAGALRSAIQRNEATASQRHAWGRGVAHALAITHQRGWVHRDLKPGNVLLRGDGSSVLTDYGLASRIGATIEPLEGTPGYVAPEVRSDARADPRIDVYAFGALARELFGADDRVFGALTAACLSADPRARPRDGAEILRALEAAGV